MGIQQVRRARAWFPCVDLPTGGCPVDAAITVAADQTAVASGQLVRQTRSAAAGTRTYHFRLTRATPPGQFALAVGAGLPCEGAPHIERVPSPGHAGAAD